MIGGKPSFSPLKICPIFCLMIGLIIVLSQVLSLIIKLLIDHVDGNLNKLLQVLIIIITLESN